MIALAAAIAYLGTLAFLAWERYQAKVKAPAEQRAEDMAVRVAELEKRVSVLSLKAGLDPKR